MHVSLTSFYSTLLRTSRSASRLASESFFDSTPWRPQKTLLRPCREDGAPRGVLDLGVIWVAAAFIGFGEAYLVRKDVNRSFLLMETHPNSPFFRAFFGPSRATVVYRFWKGDCYMRIWESHHVLILTTFGTMNYPIIWQHEDLGESSYFIILELCSFFPNVSTWKCDMRSLWVHYRKIGVPTELAYQYFDDPFTSCKTKLGKIDMLGSRTKVQDPECTWK